MNSSQNSSSNPLSRHPLFSVSIAFALGIFLADSLSVTPLIPGLLLVTSAVLSLFSGKARTATVLAVFVCVGYLCAALYLADGHSKSLGSLYDHGWINSGDPVQIEGVLKDHPQRSFEGVFLRVAAKRLRYKRELIETAGLVRIFVPLKGDSGSECISDLYTGNGVRFSVRLKREDQYRNPGTMSTIESLERRGLEATGSLKSCMLLERTDDLRALYSPVFEFREWLTTRILETNDPQTAGIVIAALLGNKNFLSKRSGNIFRENGTFHVLIISGLHITFIGGLILFLARRMTRSRLRQFLISNSLLWSYAILVGLQLPVLRAAIMYTVFLLSYAIYRQGSSLNSLGAATLVILIWRPADLQNPSFQLTFLSIFAIVGFAFPVLEKIKQIGAWFPNSGNPFPPRASRPFRIFSEILYWRESHWSQYLQKQTWDGTIEKSGPGIWFADSVTQRVCRPLFEIVFVTFAVQMFLLPLLIVNFHMIGTASFLSNIYAGATVGIQIAGSLITVLISIIDGPSGRAFAGVVAFISRIGLEIQGFVSDEILLPIRVPVYSGAMGAIYSVYFVPALSLTICLSNWQPFEKPLGRTLRTLCLASVLTVAALAYAIVFTPFSAPTPDGRFTVHFLDVGQGDSAFLVFPDGTTMLIDGGGQRSFTNKGDEEFDPDFAGVGERVVSEFLWENGYSKVDFVVSTHPDADHINGLVDVVKNFRIGMIFVGARFSSNPEYQAMSGIADKKNVPIQMIAEGTKMEIGGVSALFLNPERATAVSPGNADSIAIHFRYGTRGFLFTGDIETETERRMLGVGFPMKSDVVKVPHHGSRTSSTAEFVEAVEASYAVFPVGVRSPYGHPHKAVMRRWEDAGADVVILGKSGTATFSTDGSDLRVGYLTER